MTIALAAGGTAGHIEPALATARAIKALNSNQDIFLIGTPKGLESKLVPSAGFKLELIRAQALPRKLSIALLKMPFSLLLARSQAIKILKKNKVDLVVGFGAYVSYPVYLAAKKLKIPVIIHEGNAKPGIANKFFAKDAKIVFQCFEHSLPKAITVGMPLRETIANSSILEQKSEAIELFKLNPQKRTLLVFGGSQGALKINQALFDVIGLLTAAGYQVLHAVGPNKPITQTLDIYPDYHPVSYIDRMDLAYAAADLVISRSGAMTVAEVTALGKVAIFIPFPSGNGEQSLNIKELISAGGAFTVSDSELTGERLFTMVNEIFKAEARFQQVAEISAGFGRRDAAQVLADSALALIEESRKGEK
jgi:UDP-N-acetylglucosamine--N-acetylmuramyl-(pentapeptide) pyrophosphoryl-undecaprenol N-acetylglucosamine transferase